MGTSKRQIEYSSDELHEIANQAESHTIEETIEALCQKEITEAQMHYCKRMEYLTSTEFYLKFYKENIYKTNIRGLCDAHINKVSIILQDNREYTKESLERIKDYRLEAYHQGVELF